MLSKRLVQYVTGYINKKYNMGCCNNQSCRDNPLIVQFTSSNINVYF